MMFIFHLLGFWTSCCPPQKGGATTSLRRKNLKKQFYAQSDNLFPKSFSRMQSLREKLFFFLLIKKKKKKKRVIIKKRYNYIYNIYYVNNYSSNIRLFKVLSYHSAFKMIFYNLQKHKVTQMLSKSKSNCNLITYFYCRMFSYYTLKTTFSI